MAFVSGGGGGLPPQAPQPSAGSQLPGINNQLLETLLLQQQQQAANSQGNVAALLVNALLGGQLGSTAGGLGGAASLPQPQQPQQAAQNLLIQQLQNQLALSQLLGQNANLANPLLNNLTNPNLALYYQLIQQQQQTSLLQQLQQQTQQQQQTVQPAQQTPAPIPTQSLQISQSHSAFQPPQQAPSSGNVEVQAHAQEKLMADLLNSQNAQNSLAQKEIEQRMLAAGSAASTSALPDRAVPRNTKEVHDRIDKLISENAAILQPQEPLLKRRPYHRAVGQQSSMDDSNSSSTRTSPGLQAAVARDPRMLAASSRTQSLYEPINGIRAFGGGSLTSGQPVVRHQQHHTPTCPYCNVPFPNEAGLQCHELRCSKRIEMEKVKEAPAPEPPQPDSRHPLKRRLLAAAVPDDVPAIQQAKLARKDSGDVIVVAETRAQPDRKESLFEQFGHPGLPRRATIGAIPTLTPAQLPQSAPEVVIPPAPTTIQPQQMISPTQATHHPTAFHQVIQGQNRVNAAALTAAQVLQQLPLQPQQLQQRHIIPLQQVIPPQQQLPSTSALPTTPQSLPPPPSHEDSPQLSINHLFPLDGNTSKPYTLVLNEGVKTTPERTNRTRNRNITSETFVCLQRAQPMFVEQKGNLSMYSNWHQITVNEADAKLNLAFMAQCSAKPKTGQHPFWKYTVANRDMVQYKVTHSSFWEISQRLRQRQAQEGDKPVAEGDETMVKMEEKENMVSPKVEEPSPIVEMKPFAEVKAENDHKQEDEFEWTPSRSPRPNKKTDPIIGGHRTDELYVYVRGRGRGRYVCDRCGIRCKKPSMLKKHIKSHTDIRPYKCKQCNFSFKTKGNLTKHLSSKTHKRRLQAGDEYESDNEDRLEIADAEEEDKEEVCFEVPDRLDDEDESDDEEMDMFDNAEEEPFRRFGQENIILERGAHTPPSRWVLEREEETDVISWPEVKAPRRCMSAPPVAVAGPLRVDTKKTAGTPSTPPLPITAMQFVAMDTSPSTIVAQISQNGLAVPQPRLNGIISSNQPYLMNFFPKEEVLKCDQCDKSFRKQADLNYHQLTHNVEKQQLSNKNRMFQCPECRIPARTKAILSKHMEQAHGSHIDESAMAQIDPSASTQSVLGGGAAQMVNNPRSFMCLDCNIGFRKHGILAKHLRSKTHVTKLETLKRLPEDALSLIQGHDNGACLNEVDTTDCEKARASLTAIVENIRSKKHENHNSTGSTPAVTITASSLECREQLTASPMPINQRLVLDSPVNGIRSSYSETSSPFRSRCGSAASTSAIDIPRKRSDSLMHKLDPSTLQAMKFISQANVWVPPKVQDQGAHRPDSIAFRQVEPMEVDNPSSCSSPVMRILAANGNKSPPIPPGTKCSVCMTNFDTPVELQVHLYTDHISVKDGTFFRCPKKLCEKVYPNKESLRIHVAAHYRAEALDPREEDSISSGACPSIRPDELEPSTPMTDGSDSSCVSPGVQDAHRTVSAGDTPAAAFACMSCTKVFSDVHSLQHHWLSHVNRGHVCQICDAGFTTQEQLLIHQATHVNHSTNGIN